MIFPYLAGKKFWRVGAHVGRVLNPSGGRDSGRPIGRRTG
jgi:hypothetical protein